jgi:hypothetical protein
LRESAVRSFWRAKWLDMVFSSSSQSQMGLVLWSHATSDVSFAQGRRGYCSSTSRHRMPSDSINECSRCVASNVCQGLAGIARHVIGRHLTQETRVQTRFDDVAGIVSMTWRAISARRYLEVHRRCGVDVPRLKGSDGQYSPRHRMSCHFTR